MSTDTHKDLLRASRAIGDIHEFAAWYTYSLADTIERRGQTVGDMTVRELMQLLADHANPAKVRRPYA